MKSWLIHVLLFACLGLVQSVSASSEVIDAQAIIKQTTDQMLSALQEQKDSLKNDAAKVYALVNKIVLPHFDFARMSKLVLARNWAQATAEQKQRFIEEFRQLLVRTYATALVEAAKEGVEVSYEPVRAKQDANRVTIQTTARLAGQHPISVDYALYFYEDRWQVYNVIVGGVSLVTNYRTEFANDIKKMGIEGLIDKIAAKQTQTPQPQ